MAVRTEVILIEDALSTVRPRGFAYVLLAIFIFIGAVEGYDVQAMAFAAPMLAFQWSLSPGTVGLLLSASVLGLVVGSFSLSPLGDRIGRRPSILIALAWTSITTGAGALAPDPIWLGATRIAAGIGLGLALPNVIALGSEISPPRYRTLVIVLISSGYPLGAAVGGAAAGTLIPHYGADAVFIVGGIGTLAAGILSALAIPESPYFQARDGDGSDKVASLLARLGAKTVPATARFRLAERPVDAFGDRIAELFAPQRRVTTSLLWTVNFANLAIVYYFINWLPTLFTSRGLEAQAAVSAAALFSGSGVIGGLAMAALMRGIGPSATLGFAYAIAIATSLALASLPTVDLLFLAILSLAGAAIVGSQFCLTAVVNEFYPSVIRATASGYATGVGRLGAITAPLAGGVILGTVGSAGIAFAAASIPAIVALLAVLALRTRLSQ